MTFNADAMTISFIAFCDHTAEMVFRLFHDCRIPSWYRSLGGRFEGVIPTHLATAVVRMDSTSENSDMGVKGSKYSRLLTGVEDEILLCDMVVVRSW